MADTINQPLDAQIENLKQQLLQKDTGIEGLSAQLDAHQGMLNESLSSNLQLKSNLILLQKHNKKLSDMVTQLETQLDVANKKVSDLLNAEPKQE